MPRRTDSHHPLEEQPQWYQDWWNKYGCPGRGHYGEVGQKCQICDERIWPSDKLLQLSST